MEKESVICIGKFNGMHLGHRMLIRYVIEEAKRRNYRSSMLTFLSYPVKYIYEEIEKKRLVSDFGIEQYITYPFVQKIMKMEAEQFIADILIRKCHAKVIVVGEDFRFGHERRGDIELLKKLSQKYGYECKCFPKLMHGNEVVSSSRIHSLLLDGRIEEVNILLGRPYFFLGTVVKGNQIGRTLDMPTVNLIPGENKILPPSGVYASFVTVNKKRYHGVTNIGKKPTISSNGKYGVETYLFDFNEDIYGKKICVELFHFLRAEKKFSGLDELKENMIQDKEQARKILGLK